MQTCAYCGCTMQSKQPARPQGMPRKAWRGLLYSVRFSTRDHVVPKSKGGQGTVRVCQICNREKYNMSLDEYRMVRLLRYGKLFFHFERHIPSLIWQYVCICVLPAVYAGLR